MHLRDAASGRSAHRGRQPHLVHVAAARAHPSRDRPRPTRRRRRVGRTRHPPGRRAAASRRGGPRRLRARRGDARRAARPTRRWSSLSVRWPRERGAGAPRDTVDARLLAGRALASVGRREEAMEALKRAAADAAEGRGFRMRDEAALQLRALGEEPARPFAPHHGRGDGELSPREREIADLVAEGRSNKQVAATLFLSDRTVEYHLSAVYRKLGGARAPSWRRRWPGADVSEDLRRRGVPGDVDVANTQTTETETFQPLTLSEQLDAMLLGLARTLRRPSGSRPGRPPCRGLRDRGSRVRRRGRAILRRLEHDRRANLAQQRAPRSAARGRADRCP